jgi:hypothetical protein
MSNEKWEEECEKRADTLKNLVTLYKMYKLNGSSTSFIDRGCKVTIYVEDVEEEKD